MKKILHISLFALILMVVLCISSFATEISYHDKDTFLDWTVNITDFESPQAYGDVEAHGRASIKNTTETEYTKNGFTIPSFVTYNDKTYVVTEIENNAFKGNNLVFGNVKLPQYLEKIGSNAFYRTRIYGDIVFPETFTTLSDGSFSECKGILTVKFTAPIDVIPSSAFYRCQSLTSVTATQKQVVEESTGDGEVSITINEIPAIIEKFNDYCFYECFALKSVPIGNGTTKIGKESFLSCKALNSVNLSTVTTLNSSAFAKCLTLETVTLPKTLDYDASVFTDCVSLKKFILPEGATKLSIVDGVLYDKDKTIVYRCPPNYKLSSIVIPETVTTISNNAFCNVTTLQSVKIGANVTSIGDYAFQNTAVSAFFIPDNVTTIGTSILSNCPFLKWVVVGNKITNGSNMVSGSTNVLFVIGRNHAFITTSTSITAPGKAYSMAAYACTEHFYLLEYTDEQEKATCTKGGINTCLACDDKIYAKPLGHSGPTIESSSLSCETDEYVIIDCERCGPVKNITAYATGHVGNKIIVPATSTAAGYTAVSCNNCNEVVIYQYTASLYLVGDINGDKLVNSSDVSLLAKYVSGASISVNKLSCDLNKDKIINIYDLILLQRFVEKLDTDIVPADSVCDRHLSIVTKNHKTTLESECENFEISVSYCADCGTLISSDVVSYTGHNWERDAKASLAPSCNSIGWDKFVCKNPDCGKTMTKNYPALEEHTGDWWTISTNKGYQYRYCSICGIFESQEVDYTVFKELYDQIPDHFATYYNKETLSLINPILENYKTALTQEQVDRNVALLKEYFPRIQYLVTDVPTIFINSLGDTKLQSFNQNNNNDYIDAAIAVAWYDENGSYFDIVDENGQAKVRGNSTANKDKKPYNIKFSNEVDLFGLGQDNKYCLLANYCDPAFIRNAVARELNKLILPEYTTKFVFVDVYCDGEYRGAYMLCTPVDIDESRIDLDENDEFILEVEWNDGGIRDDSALYFQTPYTNFRIKIDSHDVEDITPDGYASIYSTILQAEYALMSGDWEQIQKCFDVEAMAKYYVLQEFFKDVDYAWDSTRFSIDNGKISAGPLWDFDRAMGHASKTGGNANCRDAYWNSSNKPSIGGVEGDSTTGTWANAIYNGIPTENWLNNPTDTSNGNNSATNWDRQNGNHNWYTFLYMYSPEFMEIVSGYIWEYKDVIINMYADIYDSLGNRKLNYIDVLYADEDFYSSICRNFSKWGVHSEEGFSFKSFREAQEDLRKWLDGRFNWMLNFYCADQLAVENADELILSKENNSYYRTTSTSIDSLDGVLLYIVEISGVKSESEAQRHATKMYELVKGCFDITDESQIEMYYYLNDGTVLQYVDGFSMN